MGAKKNFVLDTNVLLHDPNALYQFDDNDVVIPIYVFEELDKFKRNNDALGHNARQVAREIDRLRHETGALSRDGVPLHTGGRLKVVFLEDKNSIESKYYLDLKAIDSKILSVALKLKESDPERETILISKDINLRIRADTLGLKAEDYKPEKTPIDDLYTGFSEHFVSTETINRLYSDRELPLSQIEFLKDEGEPPPPEFLPNQCLSLTDQMNLKHTALARINPDGETVKLLSEFAEHEIWGIRARNREQRFALELLLDPQVQLVTLVGKAGTGKTLIALAAALQQTLENKSYQRLLVSRPVMPMGKDIGFLPGSVEEKLTPWMKSIFDNLEFLFYGAKKSDLSGTKSAAYKELVELGVLQIEPLTYIRGRSIPNQFIIIDEAQNLTPHEVKTIITRAGENTKVVLTGDPYQIDHPYIDSSNNGLVYTVSRFKGQKLFGHVTLTKGERSELAELAANLL